MLLNLAVLTVKWLPNELTKQSEIQEPNMTLAYCTLALCWIPDSVFLVEGGIWKLVVTLKTDDDRATEDFVVKSIDPSCCCV